MIEMRARGPRGECKIDRAKPQALFTLRWG
jgi:hypothetical protein